MRKTTPCAPGARQRYGVVLGLNGGKDGGGGKGGLVEEWGGPGHIYFRRHSM